MDGNREIIHAFGRIFSVEISGADDFLRVGEDERIIGRRVDLRRNHVLHKLDSVVRDAVNLRHAADRVRVLHFVAKPMRNGDLRRIRLRMQQGSKSTSCFALTGMRTRVVDVAAEGGRRAFEDFQRQSGDDVRLTGQILASFHALGAEGGDELSTVD